MSTTTTPWGVCISDRPVAVGIRRVSTSSHGGLILDADRWEALERVLGGPVAAFAGRPYLEEDVDQHLAVLVWPQFFSPLEVWEAVRMFSGTAETRYQPMILGRRYVARPNTLAVAKAKKFERDHAEDWVVGGMSFTGATGRLLFLQRVGNMEESVTVQVDDYPEQIPIPGSLVAGMKRV